MNRHQRRQLGFSVVYVLIAILGMWIFQEFVFRPMIVRQTEVPYSRFLSDLESGRITTVTLGTNRIYYVTVDKDGHKEVHNTVRVDDKQLIDRLVAAKVRFQGEPPTSGLGTAILGWLIPLLPLVAIWYYIFRKMGQGGTGVMSIGKSRAHEIAGEMTGIKFSDVGGVDEVEVELREIIDFLKDPSRFTRMGAKLPKGVLLVGPPGTGKTLLAKATAGEAGVPFFSISGSEFVEMFVGVGAARVRDLFEQAKRKAPCIVFIDEIDAIGRARTGVGAIGTNDEREQTLNQLLTEMDGFEPNQGVVIMAATNRPEVLDPALLRPGRFDRQIQVGLPTEEGRKQILAIHTRHVKLGADVDLDRLAQITAGFSGADLANIVNEAALLAVRRNAEAITMDDFDRAIERVVAGLEKKVPLKPEIKRRVAYHEGGHALVAALLPHTDPVHKVNIIPTAKGALGYTLQRPEEDQYLLSEEELRERLAVLLGGRAAELLVFGEASTGAANDLDQATNLARRMVTEFGMTDALGPVRYAPEAGYLGAPTGVRPEVSPETANLIDKETRRLVEEAQSRAISLLREHKTALERVAALLQEREVISGEEIQKIIAEEKGIG
ncbi:MAG TPA: ATP-dependent metallopeptidase FtsH/Yme1/Tma family protein [Candidatus Acetothermia bacterium]|nr:ATP-dependent metallopeptidase FtsH/Yme1/Tma family protein [Candidatus Acetothermia bacterium]